MADTAGRRGDAQYTESPRRAKPNEGLAVKLNLLLLLMIAGAAIAAILLSPQASAATEPWRIVSVSR